MWRETVTKAADLRARLAAIDGISVLDESHIPPASQLDCTKVLIDVSALGVAGYAIDDWLNEHHRLCVGLSDARHLLAIVSAGTTTADVKALAKGLGDCVARLRTGDVTLTAAADAPRIGTLTMDMAAAPADAFFGPVERIALEEAEGRIAAENRCPCPAGRASPRSRPADRRRARRLAYH